MSLRHQLTKIHLHIDIDVSRHAALFLGNLVTYFAIMMLFMFVNMFGQIKTKTKYKTKQNTGWIFGCIQPGCNPLSICNITAHAPNYGITTFERGFNALIPFNSQITMLVNTLDCYFTSLIPDTI